MVSIRLPYLDVCKDRFDRWHAYFRHKGRRVRIRHDLMNTCAFTSKHLFLDALATSDEFMQHYRELRAELGTVKRASSSAPRQKGSVGALATEFFKSPEFRGLAEATQKEYRRVIERFCDKFADDVVAKIERRHVSKWRNERAETPGAANTFIRVIKRFLSYGVDEGWLRENPARGVKEFKIGEFRAWKDPELAKFRECWAEGTMQRRAFELALCTGQRRADLVVMSKAHCTSKVIEGQPRQAIQVVQQKTGARVTILMHERLEAALNAGKHDHLSLLVTTEGKSFDAVYFGGWFKDAITMAGLPDDCQLHGLRKTAARMLAEAGCTELEIMAITGHTTSRMVARYTKDADQESRANAAILKLERNRK